MENAMDHTRIILCTLVLSVFAGQVVHADQARTKLRVGVSGSWVSAEIDSFAQTVQNSNGTILEYHALDTDASAEGLGLHLGYTLNESWELELDVVPTVSSSRSVSWGIEQIDPPPVPPSGASGFQRMDFEHRLVALGAIHMRPVAESIDMYGRLGLGWIRSEAEVGLSPGQTALDRPDSHSSVVPYIGIGVRYRFDAGPTAFADFSGGTGGLMTSRIGLTWTF
jgi:hypothetical protein